MTDVTITREDGGPGGRYVARIEGLDAEGELTFTRQSEGLISADHTGVPESMGGRGVGKALVQALVADARASGDRIVPLCSFVRAEAERHPEWADVFADPGDDRR